MKKQKKFTLTAAQGAGTISAPESEISNIATVTIDKLNDKDEVVETEEFKLEVVDEDTKDWQHTFWNVMWLASRTKPTPTTTWSNEEKAEAIMAYAEDLYADPTLCLRHLVWTADRLRKVEGFDAYCSRLGLNPDCVAQHIVFDGYYNVQAVIKLGVEEVYGAYVLLADRNLRPRVTGHDNSFNSYLSEGTIQQWIAPSIFFITDSASLHLSDCSRSYPSKSA